MSYLEPHVEKAEDDVGKNLVDIILTNNGYEVVNIGIKQPINTILEVAQGKSAEPSRR